jgi:hypothetical protein
VQQVCRALPHWCVLLLELFVCFVLYYTIPRSTERTATFKFQVTFGTSFGENPMIDHLNLPSQAQDKHRQTT